jgi:hypothetical protein
MAANAESATPSEAFENTEKPVSVIRIIIRFSDYLLMFGVFAALVSAAVLLAGLFVYGIHWVGASLSTRTQLNAVQATFAVILTLVGVALVFLLGMGVSILASIKEMGQLVAGRFIARDDEEEESDDEDEDDESEPKYVIINPFPPSKSQTFSPRCSCGSGRLYKNCCGRDKRKR